ncbi:MAG: FdhF/YdeP family oxidoreductase, partial [Dehalococcoidia bacterium]
MAKPRVSAGGGLPAMWYVVKKGRESGSYLGLYKRLRSKNTCKTCALGMGGQQGGMVNEKGHFPEICKKSVQAQAGDMGAFITEAYLRATPIASMASLSSREFERLGRLVFPVMAGPGDTHFRRIGWDEAYRLAGGALRQAPPDEVFFYASGRSSNEAAFLMQLVARAFGTANIHNCSYYCHSASGVALEAVYGSGTSSVTLDDLALADVAVVAGANPASNHPRLITQLMQLKRRGGKVVVINPLKELGLVRFRVPSDVRSMLFGSEIADIYLQPHAGSDAALFMALLKSLVERGGIDQPYLDAHTDGWPALRSSVEATPWDTLVEACGVTRAEIEAAAAALGAARRGILLWAMGLTHHANGVDNILALSNLALARGWLGRPGSGLLPIRGHSNVQGVGSVGVAPKLKASFAERLDELYGISAPKDAGQHTYASMEAAAAGRIQAAFLMGGNLFSSNPDRDWAANALRSIPVSVSVTTKLNEGHVHGRGQTALILPALARDEEAEATTQESMFNFVRLSEGGEPAVNGQMRSEVEIIAAIAQRILPPGRFDWAALRSHHHLREMISQAVPGYGPIAAIDSTGGEFHVGGRTFHKPEFATPSGRAQFHVTPLPEFAPGPGEFRLMTIRSEGQFNTVVYDEEDLYRGNKRRDVVMMAAADARRLGLAEGVAVSVASDTGRMTVRVAITDIRASNVAMYYPEANILVPRKLDERSKTPAFKSVAVRIE